MHSPHSSSHHSETLKRKSESQVIRQHVRKSIKNLRDSYLAETSLEETHEILPRVAGKGNAMALTNKRENHNEDVKDELFAEQLQL